MTGDDVATLLRTSLEAHQGGDARRAAVGYLQVLAREPKNPDALHLLGLIMKGGGCPQEAAKLIRKALKLQPGFADALYNLGNTYVAMGDLAEAVKAFKGAVKAAPKHAPSWSALSLVLRQAGALDPATMAARKAAALALDQPELRLALAELLLLAGADAAGFEAYEARPQPAPPADVPLWDGGRLRGRVVVVAEPVTADILLFSRHLAALRARVGRLALVCPAKFVPLFQAQRAVDDVMAEGEAWPSAKAWVPLTSLARLCPEATAPHLVAPPADVERWAATMAHDGLRIGLAWAGDPPRFPGEPPLTLQHFLTLPMPPGARYFSLQTGPRAIELAALDLTETVAELGPHLADFADLAAALAHLDLVITCDSAVAHLVGAMGRPAWVLLPTAPDWRWRQRGETVPWYPGVRLFRQSRRGDWPGLLETVGRELQAAVAEGRFTPPPPPSSPP